MRQLLALLLLPASALAGSPDARRLEALRVELVGKMAQTSPLVEKLQTVRTAYQAASDPRPFEGERLTAVQLLALRLDELQDLHDRFNRARDAQWAQLLLKPGREGADLLLANDAKLFSESVRLFREKAKAAFIAEDGAWQAALESHRVRRRWQWALALTGLFALLTTGGLAAWLRAGSRPSSG